LFESVWSQIAKDKKKTETEKKKRKKRETYPTGPAWSHQPSNRTNRAPHPLSLSL
jgi:hypothetical protein